METRSPSLTDPVACPGLLEWLSVAAAESSSRLPLASFVAWLNAAGVFLALVALTRWIGRAAGGVAAEISVSLAAAVTLVTRPALAPADVLAVGAAAAAWLATVSAARSRRGRHAVLAWLALAATAAIAPPVTAPLAAAAAWITWAVPANATVPRRAVRAAVAAILVVAGPAAVLATLPSMPGQEVTAAGCIAPGSASIAQLRDALTGAFTPAGPVPVALAMLGAFGLGHAMGRSSIWPIAALAVASAAAAAWSTSTPVRTLAPAITALWWMAAAGFREITDALAGRPAWRAGAWALALLLPALQWSHRSAQPVDAADHPRGHEQLTRRDVSQVLAALPSGSTIVEDDAITGLLLRSAAETARQSGKVFTTIPRNGRDAARAARQGRVYAMPRAQFDLQHHGLRRADAGAAVMPGVVAFETAGACAVVETRWVETAAPAPSSRIAVVASQADARGPVLVYLGSPVALSPHPLDWPAWALRGYYADTYDFRREADRQRFDSNTAEDRPPPAAGVFKYPHITRLELWRVPNGPMALPLGLDHQPEIALIRGSTAADGLNLEVCPSFPEAIGPLVPRR